jgi:hypothetical protein
MKTTQIGWVTIIICLAVSGLVTFFQKIGFNSLWTMWLIVLIVLLLFYKLTIVVDEKYVRFSFGIGIFKKKYLLSDIISCKPIKYFPLGWGIRFRPGVILYNVSGNKAVELEIKGKWNKVWIGTNKPDEVAEYINKVRG